MALQPYRFLPIYKPKIWGGRNLSRLYGRTLPAGEKIGESWELADLVEGVSVASNGPEAGKTLTQLVSEHGDRLLGGARAMPGGRFPLLLKLLDANAILSLQVHPDDLAAREIGEEAAPKTECWYVIESRNGYIYKGVTEGVTSEAFREAIEKDDVERLVRKIDCRTGDFHFLPSGTVHALGPGMVVAEVQTPSDTTYRVTDWGRGREIHVDLSMRCIHFEPARDEAPGSDGETLLATEFFTVAKRSAGAGNRVDLPHGRCSALMILSADEPAIVRHAGDIEPQTYLRPGDTLLLPAALERANLAASAPCEWLEVTLPEG